MSANSRLVMNQTELSLVQNRLECGRCGLISVGLTGFRVDFSLYIFKMKLHSSKEKKHELKCN